MTANEIATVLAKRHWSFFKQVCVPRCHFAGAEADLLILQPSGFLEEVEIKISANDFRREFVTKRGKHQRLMFGVPDYHFHEGEGNSGSYDPNNPLHEACTAYDGRVYGYKDYTDAAPHQLRRFWFAMPEELAVKLADEIPDWAGLIAVGRRPNVIKQAPNLKHSRKLTDEEKMKLMRLAYLRYWMSPSQALERQSDGLSIQPPTRVQKED